MVEYEQRQIAFAFTSPSKLFTPFITCMLVLIVIGFAVTSYAKEFALTQLTLNTSSIFGLKVWQFVTYPFIAGCPISVAFNGLVVLLIGSSIEREWDTKSVAILWFAVTLVCGFFWVLVNLLAGWNYLGLGAAAPAYGFIAAFGLMFRKKRFIFWFWAMEAQVIAIIVIVIGLVIAIPTPIAWIWVAGALVSYLYIKFIWRRNLSSSGFGSSGGSANKNARGGGFVDLD